jgi:hypothetical protein
VKLDKTMQTTIQQWGVLHGHSCKSGILGKNVIDAYWTAHPDQLQALANAAGELIDMQNNALDEEPVEDDATYSITANAWTVEHADAIAEAAAILIGAVHESTSQRILEAIQQVAPCRCACHPEILAIVEAM